MSSERPPLGATNARLTFRTYKECKRKLEGIAIAHDLRISNRPSIGAALNLIILGYDDSAERAINKRALKKKTKGAKR